MIKIMQTLLSLFNKHKDKLPENMDSVEEITGKAQDLYKQHGDKIDDVVSKLPKKK